MGHDHLKNRRTADDKLWNKHWVFVDKAMIDAIRSSSVTNIIDLILANGHNLQRFIKNLAASQNIILLESEQPGSILVTKIS